MRHCRIIATSILICTASAGGSFGAAQNDPSWPCVQRKVPELSVGQVWNGPDIPDSAKGWDNDAAIHALVDDLAARRNPLDTAQNRIVEFANGLPRDQVNNKMLLLFQGLFDTLNRERIQVISGISRYAGKQREMANDLRTEAARVDAMRGKPDTDPDDLDRANERLTWETRIFQERVQSLTYVCEVPTIIEQRLYSLSKTISQSMLKQ